MIFFHGISFANGRATICMESVHHCTKSPLHLLRFTPILIMRLPEPWEEAHDRQGQIHYSKPMKSSEFTQEVVTTEVIIVTRGSEL